MPDFDVGNSNPSFLDEIGQAFKNAFDFVGGAVYAVAEDLSMGALDRVLNDDADQRSESYQHSKVLGDEVSVGVGAVATIAGLMEAVGGAAGGLVFSETGVGVLAGGAIAAEGIAEASIEAGVTVESLQSLQKDTMRFAKTNENRPSWRQSENDIASENPNYAPQKSFKDGKPVKYGTKNSVRPDFYKEGHSIEVKNYDLTSDSGKSVLFVM